MITNGQPARELGNTLNGVGLSRADGNRRMEAGLLGIWEASRESLKPCHCAHPLPGRAAAAEDVGNGAGREKPGQPWADASRSRRIRRRTRRFNAHWNWCADRRSATRSHGPVRANRHRRERRSRGCARQSRERSRVVKSLGDLRAEGEFRGYLGSVLARMGGSSMPAYASSRAKTCLAESAISLSLAILLCSRAETEHVAGEQASATRPCAGRKRLRQLWRWP